LQCRYRALKGIEMHGWEWRLMLANEARARYRQERGRQDIKAKTLLPFFESSREQY
jgi:hypothetical protein